MAAVAAAESVEGEVLPPSLDSTAEPPLLFDGTTRYWVALLFSTIERSAVSDLFFIFFFLMFSLRMSWEGDETCRVGLQKKIKLVPIDLQNRPSWYKEQVYPTNKVRFVRL
ncbi:hypothetical protein Taro_035292 [Colocasia esculenta]|uniref:Uncharacterized protein n=1 Tax=Colocasia esculenta TaxID=4460 RepID=A0A843VYN7_COLES|nr:hypothetical protein [Colocasia esculenta]